MVDIFRIQNGKVVEHWDVIQDEAAEISPAKGSFGLPPYIVRTARNRALPSATRWYAFGASASGYVSTIVLTFPILVFYFDPHRAGSAGDDFCGGIDIVIGV